MKLGGLITVAVGTALMIFLRSLVPAEPIYLQGLIPFLVGVVLLAYSHFIAQKP